MALAQTIRPLLRELAYRVVPGGRLIRRGPSTGRRVALTFDDGPGPLTPQFLDVLDAHGAAGTFFLMGDHAEEHPHLIREYVRRGHQIGIHGYDHKAFTILDHRELDAQLRATRMAIGDQPTGREWVRPPYGALDARSFAQLLARGNVIAMWSHDSHDYKATDPEPVIAQCAPERIAPGEVILLHEEMPATLVALPRIIEALHADGYECVTMADLFAS
jgi:peptidoglycan-N-acetylglucosamine deacetylase